MEQKNALGRRKSAVARVYLSAGQGNVTINGRSVEEYFKTDALRYIEPAFRGYEDRRSV